jgi:sulfur transfer complex TusBCD TusB component (DsrH family)
MLLFENGVVVAFLLTIVVTTAVACGAFVLARKEDQGARKRFETMPHVDEVIAITERKAS